MIAGGTICAAVGRECLASIRRVKAGRLTVNSVTHKRSNLKQGPYAALVSMSIISDLLLNLNNRSVSAKVRDTIEVMPCRLPSHTYQVVSSAFCSPITSTCCQPRRRAKLAPAVMARRLARRATKSSKSFRITTFKARFHGLRYRSLSGRR